MPSVLEVVCLAVVGKNLVIMPGQALPYCRMDQDRLRQIETLVLSIKKKSQAVRKQARALNSLNSKLEVFLMALDAYSLDAKEQQCEPARAGGRTKAEALRKNITTPVKKTKREEPLDARSAIAMLFRASKTQKSTALEIYKLLENNEVVGLDDIVKSIKMSKYRVIEILNSLVRERIVLKHFDKGFLYKINKEM